MHKRHWLRTIVTLVVIRSLTLAAFAQDFQTSAMPRGMAGFQSRMDHAVGLTPEQREAVHGLLAQQHQDLQALREGVQPKLTAVQQDTDAKIRALLNTDQQKKFDAFLAKQKQAKKSKTRARRTS